MNRVVTGALREVPPLVTVAPRAVMESPQVVVQEAHHPLEDLGTLVGGMDTLDTGARMSQISRPTMRVSESFRIWRRPWRLWRPRAALVASEGALRALEGGVQPKGPARPPARAHVLPSDTGAGTRATAAPGTPLENHKATPLQTEAAIPHNRVDKGTVILPEGVTTEQGGPRPFLENTKAPQPQLGHPQYQIG